jgi:hypothetical protein
LFFINNFVIKLLESANVFSNFNQRNEGLIGEEQKKWIKVPFKRKNENQT